MLIASSELLCQFSHTEQRAVGHVRITYRICLRPREAACSEHLAVAIPCQHFAGLKHRRKRSVSSRWPSQLQAVRVRPDPFTQPGLGYSAVSRNALNAGPTTEG